MALEVGVRITRDTGDLTFASTETEAVFVLAAHLPGFTRDEIEVAMNEGDSQIIIRGGGHIAFQEAVITSRVAITREVSIECFDESFRVPDNVDLDGIDAWFDEEEKILIISIPKLLTNELPHDKPKIEKLPEPRELHRHDGKPQLEIIDQEMETKHPTKSQDIEALRTREQLKPKDLSLDLHKQRTEKPTLKVPKETREAAELTKTEKEGKVEPEQRQREEQKMPIGLSRERTTMKFQGPKELGLKQTQDRVSAPEQVLEAAQDIRSETEEELKQYEHEGKEDTEAIVVPAFEKPQAAELPQTKETKPWVYEFYEDEDHKWIGPEREPSKTRMSKELEEKYKNLQQEEEIMNQKAEKPTEKAQKQLFQVAESTKLDEEKEAKKEAEQIEETKKTDKKHKPKVRELVQVLEAVKAQPEEQEEFKQHEQEVQEHEKAIVGLQKQEELALSISKAPKTKGAPKKQESSRKKESEEYEKSIEGPAFKVPKIKEFTSQKEQKHDLPELKHWIHGFKEDEDRQLKDTNREAFETRESMKPKELSLNLPKLKTEKPKLKAPKDMSKAADLIKTGKEEQVETKLHQPEELEKESEQHEQDLKKQDIRSETEDELKQCEHEGKEDTEPIVVPAFKKPKAAELPQTKEPKPWVYEFYEDEDHQWIGPDREPSQTRMSIELDEKYKNLQQEEEIMKQKAQKPPEKAQKQLFQVAESTKLDGEKEAKKEAEQIKEQEAQEYKKPIIQPPHEEVSAKKLSEPNKTVQAHEKVGVKELDQILEAARQIQSVDMEELQKHEDEVQEHEKFIVVPTYEKPKAVDLIKTVKEEKVETKLHQSEELEKESEQHEQDLKKQEKTTKKVQKLFEEATKPAQSEDEEKEEQRRHIRGMPTYEVEQEQQFKISAEEGREHEIIAEPLEPEKQEEPIPKEPTILEKERKPMLENIESQEHQKPIPYQTTDMIDFKTPGITKKKEEKQREQLDRKQKKWDKTTLFESETEKYKIPIADSLEIKGIQESHEPYEKPRESVHVEPEMQLKPPGETKAQETACSAVGAQLPGKPTVGPSEQESQTKQLEQATDLSIPRIQQTESKRTKKHEEPLRQFMEDESKDQPEQQFKQPDEEEVQKRASLPEQELARNGATLEPPDRAARTNAVVETVMEQKLYRTEEGELQQDIKSPKSQKPPPIPSELEGGQVPEHDETTLEPPKPLPRVRETMETGSPPLPTMDKEAKETTITPPTIRGAMEPEGLPLLPSSDEETTVHEFPTLFQKELHPGSDLQNAEEQKTASRQMPDFEESAAEQEGKTKEPPPPHGTQEEIQRPTEDTLHRILEVPKPMKICEREFKIYAPKELEEEQELNPPLPFDHDKKTLEEEVSSDEVEPSCVEMDKSTKVRKLTRRRRFHCRCRGGRPAYPIPPSTLLSGSAFVFSIMVLVFHFIKRKKPN